MTMLHRDTAEPPTRRILDSRIHELVQGHGERTPEAIAGPAAVISRHLVERAEPEELDRLRAEAEGSSRPTERLKSAGVA